MAAVASSLPKELAFYERVKTSEFQDAIEGDSFKDGPHWQDLLDDKRIFWGTLKDGRMVRTTRRM